MGAMTGHDTTAFVGSIDEFFQPRWPVIQVVVSRTDECSREGVQCGDYLFVGLCVVRAPDFQSTRLEIEHFARQKLEIGMSYPQDRPIGFHRLPQETA
jgi:hypothetical protein